MCRLFRPALAEVFLWHESATTSDTNLAVGWCVYTAGPATKAPKYLNQTIHGGLRDAQAQSTTCSVRETAAKARFGEVDAWQQRSMRGRAAYPVNGSVLAAGGGLEKWSSAEAVVPVRLALRAPN